MARGVEIAVEGLAKTYGRVRALSDVSASFPSSKITVVVGPSGAGKTTLLRLIAGLEAPDSGRILFDGRPVEEPPEKRGIGMVFQSLALFPHMSVFENIAFGLRASRMSREHIERRVLEVARLLRIEEKLWAKPGELSGGQQQRVALARAVAPNPRALLLDEPFSNLDPRLREEMRWELKRIQQETEATVIHVTHDHNEAVALADHLVVLKDGRVLQQGEAEWVLENPANSFVAWFLGYNVVELDGEKVCFRPTQAHLTSPGQGELVGRVGAIQNTLYGKRVRVEDAAWSVEVFAEEPPKPGTLVGIKLAEKIRLKE